jgi:hypothetical protein
MNEAKRKWRAWNNGNNMHIGDAERTAIQRELASSSGSLVQISGERSTME